MTPRAWVFNLDAEDELAHEGPHTPTAALTARARSLLPQLSALLRPGDQVLWPGEAAVAPGAVGQAWCPTRWALEQLERAGVQRPPAPAQAVLRQVNHRRFCAELGQTLPGACFVEDEAQLQAALARDAVLAETSTSGAWLLKRPLGYAGRGRLRLLPRAMSAAEASWLSASLRGGEGLQLEPLVDRTFDCALHGQLSPDGRCTFGQLTVQAVDARGAWQRTTLAPEGSLTATEWTALQREAERTAAALHDAGYFGPFGLDAFRWRAPDGSEHFQPRSEVNARYSMGWAVGFPQG